MVIVELRKQLKNICHKKKELYAKAQEKNYKYAIRHDFDFRVDKDRKVAITGSFLKQQLDEFFRLHPETLRTSYSHFAKFYTQDGKPVSLTSFLSTKHSTNYEGFLLNQAVARFRDHECLSKGQIDGFSLEKKHDMVVNLRIIIGAAYRKISFCKDRLTMNSNISVGDHNNENKIGGMDEMKLLSSNCRIYCNVANGYANTLNNLLRRYPELIPQCGFSIEQVNNYLKLIVKDINEMNAVVDDNYKLDIPQMHFVGNDEARK